MVAVLVASVAAVSAGLLAFAGTGLWDRDSAAVGVPVPTGGSAAGCEAFTEQLPGRLGPSLTRRRTTPPSLRTAAYGDPPVTIRCGVPRPDGLTPGVQPLEVDGVAFYFTPTESGTELVVVDRPVYISVVVPNSYSADAVLVDVARAVRNALPKRDIDFGSIDFGSIDFG